MSNKYFFIKGNILYRMFTNLTAPIYCFYYRLNRNLLTTILLAPLLHPNKILFQLSNVTPK